MKTIMPLVLVALTLFFASCDDVKEATMLKINNVEIQETIPVDVVSTKSATEVYPFSETYTVSSATIPDLELYIGRVNSVNFDEVTFEVTDVDPDVVAEITVSEVQYNLTASLTPVPVNEPFEVFSVDQMNVLAEQFLANETMTLTISGTSTVSPVSFNVIATIIVDFEVETL